MDPAFKPFFDRICSVGQFGIVCVHPSTNKSFSAAFKDFDEASEYATQVNNTGFNVYFHPNAIDRKLEFRKTAYLGEISHVVCFYVDIDSQEKKTGLKKAAEFIERTGLKTSFVVDSGNGLHLYWMLPIPVETSPKLNARIEGVNRNLGKALDGDNKCWNLNRLLRIPGTKNFPNETKLRKGYKIVKCALLKASETVVSLEGIEKSLQYELLDSDPSSLATTKGLTIAAVNDLIVKGQASEFHARYPSRSEAVFAVCCALVRQGYSMEQIADVIRNPKNGISAHVLEQRNTGRYIERQAQRAVEAVAKDKKLMSEVLSQDSVAGIVEQLNNDYFIILNDGGRCIVGSIDEKDNGVVTQTSEEFFKRWANREVIVTNRLGRKSVSTVGRVWWNSPDRRQYEKIEFAPGEHLGEHIFNSYMGFAKVAKEGKMHRSYIDHVLKVICSGNKEVFHYIVKWMAWTVQNPGKPAGTAIVIRGVKGCGKTMFADILGALFGKSYLALSDSERFVGKFNGHLRNAILVLADEAFFAGDKRQESTLKTLITSDTIQIERKGRDTVTGRNCVHLIIASNKDWVVPVSAYERRFCITDASDHTVGNFGYFQQLHDDMYKNGGLEHLLHYLQTFDLGNFQPRQLPTSDEFKEKIIEQQILAQDPLQSWLFDMLILQKSYGEKFTLGEIYRSYTEHCHTRRINRILTAKIFARNIGMRFSRAIKINVEGKGQNAKEFYIMPSREEAKQLSKILLEPVKRKSPSQ